MIKIVDFFKRLLKRTRESVYVVRPKDVDILHLKEEALRSSPGKHIKPRQVTEPFVCNGGVNCPWTDEMPFPIDDVRFTSRETCLKCGKVSAGSCQ